MTVSEFIDKLKWLPQDAEVCVPEHDGGAPERAHHVELNPYADYFPFDYVVVS